MEKSRDKRCVDTRGLSLDKSQLPSHDASVNAGRLQGTKSTLHTMSTSDTNTSVLYVHPHIFRRNFQRPSRNDLPDVTNHGMCIAISDANSLVVGKEKTVW